MDAGTDAFDILDNRGPFKLKHGFIGVVCRSQQDISNEKPITLALEAEMAFLENHPSYRLLTAQYNSSGVDRIGSKYLSLRLKEIFLGHIKEKLPLLKLKVQKMHEECARLLLEYQIDFDDCADGASGPTTDTLKDERLLLLKCITKFCNDFTNSIQGGSAGKNNSRTTTSGLTGGARLYSLFHDKFTKTIQKLDPLTNLTEHDIYLAIKNSSGLRPSLFLPEHSFEILVKNQIQLLLEPCLLFMDEIYGEIINILRCCAEMTMLPSSNASNSTAHSLLNRKGLLSKYPLLRETLVKKSEEILKERIGPMRQMICQYIGIQAAYINTNHPDFVNSMTTVEQISKYYEGKKKTAKSFALGKNRILGGLRNSVSASTMMNTKEASMADELQDSTGDDNAANKEPPPSNKAISHPPPAQHLNTSTHSQINGGTSSILNYFFRGSSASSVSQVSHDYFKAGPPNATGINAALNSHAAVAVPKKMTSAAGASVMRSHNEQSFDKMEVPEKPENSLTNAFEPLLFTSTAFSTASDLTEKDEMEVQIILALLNSYFSIVKNNVIDFIPKSIMYFILQYLMDNMQNILVSCIYSGSTGDEQATPHRPSSSKTSASAKSMPPYVTTTTTTTTPNLSDLLREDEGIKREKQLLKNLVKIYQTAKVILDQVSDGPSAFT